MSSPDWVAVGSALLRAEEAVKADNEGKYKQALVCYKDAILLLDEQVLEAVTDEQREKLFESIQQYTNRIDVIITHIPELGTSQPATSLSAFAFKEQPPIGNMPETPPGDLRLRPFWLMKLLAQTMTRGGFMTAKLYIPPNVWFQQGAKFTAIDTKFTNCETILIWLQKLQDDSLNDANKTAKELDEFCSQIEVIQNALARKLKFISELKQEKAPAGGVFAQMGSKITKTVERLQANVMRLRIEDDTEYIKLLVQIFELSQFFTEWIVFFESEKNDIILGKLKRVSDFFYNVVCAFVLRDFSMLLERYMKKTRQSYLTPLE